MFCVIYISRKQTPVKHYFNIISAIIISVVVRKYDFYLFIFIYYQTSQVSSSVAVV